MLINDNLCCNKNETNSNYCNEHNDVKIITTDTCNICLEKLNEYVSVKCGHMYHFECIKEWLSNKNTCPCCRKVIKQSNIDIDPINTNMRERRTRMTLRFINWLQYMISIYVHDNSGISILDMLLVIQTQQNHYDCLIYLYENDINYNSIDVFQLELKLNEIADELRNNTSPTFHDDNDMDTDYSENEYDEYDE